MNVTATGKGTAQPATTGNRAEASAASGGKTLPPTGKATPAEPEHIAKAVEQIQAYLRDSKSQIEFQVDEASGHTVMRIVDAAGQVIRQIPSEEVLRIAALLDVKGFHGFTDVA
jgi:flagellar protein FlaG